MFCKILSYGHKNLFAPQTWDLLEKLALIFSLQLSSRTRFDKINKKKVIAENQCEKHKKSSLTLKAPITTAADDKFCNIFPSSEEIRYDIS